MFQHGAGQICEDLFTTPVSRSFFQALCDAGYIVASSTAHGNSWGNADLIADTKAIYRYCRDHFNITSVILGGQSMGGIATMNVLAAQVIPGVSAVFLVYPSWSLASVYGIPSLTAGINAAYGINGNYAIQTAGYDPSLKPASAFLGVPIWYSGSPNDTMVPLAANGTAMQTALAATNSITYYPTTGDHGDPTNFDTSAQTSLLAFLATQQGNITQRAPADMIIAPNDIAPDYEEYEYSTTFYGYTLTPVIVFSITRVGRLVTITQISNNTDGPRFSHGGTTDYRFKNTTVLPARFRPVFGRNVTAIQIWDINGKGAEGDVLGSLDITSDGVMTIAPCGSAYTDYDFHTTSPVGWNQFTISYAVA